MEYDFRVGDLVTIAGGMPIVGEITYIDANAKRADVEYEWYDYITTDSFPFTSLILFDRKNKKEISNG